LHYLHEVTLTEPDTLLINYAAPSVICNQATAQVDIDATGGTWPYFGTGSFTVPAGAYTYTVDDIKRMSEFSHVRYCRITEF